MILLNFTLHASFLNSNNDVTGWGSLLIGSAIGIYITFAILIYSDNQQRIINDILLEQEKLRKSRQSSAHLRIASNLSMIIDFMYQAKQLLISVEQGNSNKQETKESVERINNFISGFIDSTETAIEHAIDVLDPDFARKILTICHSKPHFDLESSYTSQDYSSIKQLLKLIMNAHYVNYTRFQNDKYYQ